MLYRHIKALNDPRGIINSRDGVFLDSQLTNGRHIDNLTEKRNQRRHVCTQIRPHLTHTVSETYLLAMILSATPRRLPLRSATTKDFIEPAQRRAHEIHGSLPRPWTRHCTFSVFFTE